MRIYKYYKKLPYITILSIKFKIMKLGDNIFKKMSFKYVKYVNMSFIYNNYTIFRLTEY